MRRSSSYVMTGIAMTALSLGLGAGRTAAQAQVHRATPAATRGADRGGTMSMDEMRAKVRELRGTMSRMVGQSEGTVPGTAMTSVQGGGMMGGQGQQEMGQSMMGPAGADMMGPSGEGGMGQGEGSMVGLTQSVSDLTGCMDQVMRQLQAMLSNRQTMGAPKLEREGTWAR
jgi:hypothetical protein